MLGCVHKRHNIVDTGQYTTHLERNVVGTTFQGLVAVLSSLLLADVAEARGVCNARSDRSKPLGGCWVTVVSDGPRW